MRRFGSVLVLCLVVTAFGAQAQDKFPSKPIKVVVPFGPGSATDIVMRIVGEHMRPILGQPVVIENKPGAFGILPSRIWRGRGPTVTRCRSETPEPTRWRRSSTRRNSRSTTRRTCILVTRLSEVPLVLAATTKDFAPEDLRRVHRLCEGEPGQGALCQRRHRQQQSL